MTECASAGCKAVAVDDSEYCIRCRLVGLDQFAALPQLNKVQSGVLLAKRLNLVGMSQSDLARTLHVSTNLVSRWFTGKVNVSPELRPYLAEALDLTELELACLLPPPTRRGRLWDSRRVWDQKRKQNE